MTLIEADDAATIAARRTIIVILALLALRLLMSATMPLIADEAYAVVASRTPTLSYFDHPPLAFDLARLSAWLFGSESGFVVRLPYVLLGSATAWLIFLITRRAFGAEAGFWASAAYGVAPFFFVSAGHFVVPDGPLNFFMMLTLWLMLPALLSEDRPSLIHWIAAGITLGLALLSKYSAVLFAFSALALLVTLPHGRRALKTPGPWLALVIAALCTLPIVVWNAENGWVSLGFQGHRATSGGFYPFNMLAVIGGNAGYIWPWTWFVAVVMIVRGAKRRAATAERVFAYFALPPIIVFSLIAMFSSEFLPHWAMPGYVFAFPLVGLWYSELQLRRPRVPGRVLGASMGLLAVLAFLTVAQTNYAAVTRAVGAPSTGDFGWTLLSYSRLGEDFAARGIATDPQAFLVTPSWVIAGKAGYDVGPDMPLATPLTDGRHLAIVSDPRLAGRSKGYAVMPVFHGEAEAGRAELVGLFAGRYRVTGEPWTIVQDRDGVPAFDIVVMPVERL